MGYMMCGEEKDEQTVLVAGEEEELLDKVLHGDVWRRHEAREPCAKRVAATEHVGATGEHTDECRDEITTCLCACAANSMEMPCAFSR